VNNFQTDIEAQLRRLEPVPPSPRFYQMLDDRLNEAPIAGNRLAVRVAEVATALALCMVITAVCRVPPRQAFAPNGMPPSGTVSAQQLQGLPTDLAYRRRAATSLDDLNGLFDERARVSLPALDDVAARRQSLFDELLMP